MRNDRTQQSYRVGDLRLETGSRRVWRGRREIVLKGKQFRLFRTLVESAPNVVSHDELADRVWGPGRVVSPENLAQHVAMLRRALSDAASSPRYIEAVRGEGYRLIPAPVALTPRFARPKLAAAAVIVAATAAAGYFAGGLLPDMSAQQNSGASSAAVPGDQSSDPYFGLPGTTDADARDMYLRALGLLEAGGVENTRRAGTLLRDAIDRDAEFVAAVGQLVRAVGNLRFMLPSRSEELLAEWETLVERLTRTVPGHPAIPVAFGLRWANEGDWVAAEKAFAAGIEASQSTEMRREIEALADMLRQVTGRYAESLMHLRQSAEADPLSLEISRELQEALYAVGDLAAAEAEYERSLDLQGDREYVEVQALMRAIVEGFDRSVIDRRLERATAAIADESDVLIALVDNLDDPGAGLRLLRSEVASQGENFDSPLAFAVWADYFGDTEFALGMLRRYYESTGRLTSGLWTPLLARTRATAGFRELAHEFGLVDYWQTTGDWGDFCRPDADRSFVCR